MINTQITDHGTAEVTEEAAAEARNITDVTQTITEAMQVIDVHIDTVNKHCEKK